MTKSFFVKFRRIFGNLYFLFFLNGFFIATLFYLNIEDNYESNLFKAIQKSIDKKISPTDTKDSILVKVMRECSDILGNRLSVFSVNYSNDLEGFKTEFLHPATVDLMTAKGACGSYSYVLARILQDYGFPVRIGQMKANGIYGSHNVVEANINSKWVVADPLFDTYFVKPGGKAFASFNDVKENWGYYSKQLPEGYDPSYQYQDVRYTNWEKIPVVLPALKKTLTFFLGKERVDSMSLRVHFLKIYKFYFYVALIIYLPILLATAIKIIRANKMPEPIKEKAASAQKQITAHRLESTT
ncbi:MAG: hypothetical protein JST47_11630 [Bacteroidetes bacterium]|nr:hypothetical protein [Bacteroidota bacterium]